MQPRGRRGNFQKSFSTLWGPPRASIGERGGSHVTPSIMQPAKRFFLPPSSARVKTPRSRDNSRRTQIFTRPPQKQQQPGLRWTCFAKRRFKGSALLAELQRKDVIGSDGASGLWIGRSDGGGGPSRQNTTLL
ncbi:hypothetical protein CDAR_548861 [Caerostris darwini]|uniref:Uncharacterized protein n=1 Tax=Caerostris darwini TaxID=1538125 RepID=A0AAV4WJV0_9ARAC|nr:hypothetical protein CDAR_548861 [Caerostris darwini]